MDNKNDISKDNYNDILLEIRKEQAISPTIKDATLISYIKEGVYDINDVCGKEIDYNANLVARSLLKNYVLYANYKRLAEFKELYSGEYIRIQRDCYIDSNVQ